MTKNGQVLAAGAALAAIAALGIYLALGERSHRHHRQESDVPEDSASAPMHGTDWNGPVGLPAAQDSAGSPQPIASDTGMPSSGVVPPPLSAIPQPTIAPPLDDTLAEAQKRRAIEMIQNRIFALQKEAEDEDRRGEASEAAATRVRIARMQARVAQLKDGGAP